MFCVFLAAKVNQLQDVNLEKIEISLFPVFMFYMELVISPSGSWIQPI